MNNPQSSTISPSILNPTLSTSPVNIAAQTLAASIQPQQQIINQTNLHLQQPQTINQLLLNNHQLQYLPATTTTTTTFNQFTHPQLLGALFTTHQPATSTLIHHPQHHFIQPPQTLLQNQLLNSLQNHPLHQYQIIHHPQSGLQPQYIQLMRPQPTTNAQLIAQNILGTATTAQHLLAAAAQPHQTLLAQQQQIQPQAQQFIIQNSPFYRILP